MENTNSLGLLLSFARPCRRLLAASVGLAVLGVAWCRISRYHT